MLSDLRGGENGPPLQGHIIFVGWSGIFGQVIDVFVPRGCLVRPFSDRAYEGEASGAPTPALAGNNRILSFSSHPCVRPDPSRHIGLPLPPILQPMYDSVIYP